MITKQTIRKVEKVIQSYIPKNTTCRIQESKNEFLRGKEKVSTLQAIEKLDMGSPLEISVNHDWVKEDPDMSVCDSCKETIYTSQYKLQYTVNGEIVERDKETVVCETCYSKMEK